MVKEYTKLQLEDKAFNALKDCDKVLDVGCGVGKFLSRCPDKFIGIDINQDNVDICLEKGLTAFQCDVTNPEEIEKLFKTNKDECGGWFDGIHCSHVLEHLMPDKAWKALASMSYMLKKQGTFVIRTPLMSDMFWDDFTHIKPYYPQAIRHYLIPLSTEQRTLKKIRWADFEEMKLEWRVGMTGYLIILRKKKGNNELS